MNEKGILAHHLMRASLGNYQRRFDELSETERQTVLDTARQSLDIENMVLSSPEATDIHVPPMMLEKAMNTVRSRYETAEDFIADLKYNGLSQDDLSQSLARELIVDAVVAKVASKAPPVTRDEVRKWYDENPQRFTKPELRTVRHILITINEGIEENTKVAALKRIEEIHAQLDGTTQQFGKMAMRYSECPSALENGLLGNVPPGTLYDALDKTLFEMEAGEISKIILTEVGYHILFCEAVLSSSLASFKEAEPKITEAMMKKRRATVQKHWMANLLATQRKTQKVDC